MKFYLRNNNKILARTHNDLVRFDVGMGTHTNVDVFGFDVSEASEFDNVNCDLGIAKLPIKIAVKGEIWFPPFQLVFRK